MKTIKKEITEYKCEVCGATSQNESKISECEKSHKCDHIWVYDWIESEEDVYAVSWIHLICRKCASSKGEVHFDNVVKDSDLKAIYNIIKATYDI